MFGVSLQGCSLPLHADHSLLQGVKVNMRLEESLMGNILHCLKAKLIFTSGLQRVRVVREQQD